RRCVSWSSMRGGWWCQSQSRPRTTPTPPPARSRNRVPTAVLFDTLSTPVAPSFEWPTKPNRTVSGLHWAYVLVGTADGTVLPFVPLYLFDRGLTAAWIGLVLAVAASASLVLGLAWAYLADRRFSPEPMVVAASVAASPVCLVLALTSGARTLGVVGILLSGLLLGASLAATQNSLTLQINVLGGGAVLVGAAAAFQALTEIPTMGYTHVLRRYLSHRVLFAIGCGVYLVIFVAWA